MTYPQIEVGVKSALILVVCVTADTKDALLPALEEVKRELQDGDTSARGITRPDDGDAAYSFDLVSKGRW